MPRECGRGSPCRNGCSPGMAAPGTILQQTESMGIGFMVGSRFEHIINRRLHAGIRTDGATSPGWHGALTFDSDPVELITSLVTHNPANLLPVNLRRTGDAGVMACRAVTLVQPATGIQF